MNCKVKSRIAVFDAVKVTEDNLHEVAVKLSSDEVTARETARKYIGAWLVFKPNQDIHVCSEEHFNLFYEPVDPIPTQEIVDALKWAQHSLGKHTRPSPVDNVLSKLAQ